MACRSCEKALDEKLGKCKSCMVSAALFALLFGGLYAASSFILGAKLSVYARPVCLFFAAFMGLLFMAHLLAWWDNKTKQQPSDPDAAIR
jgi:hypothetical protein